MTGLQTHGVVKQSKGRRARNICSLVCGAMRGICSHWILLVERVMYATLDLFYVGDRCIFLQSADVTEQICDNLVQTCNYPEVTRTWNDSGIAAE